MPGDSGKASVLLLHGIRANRLAMVGGARMLAKHGYSVLLIDLPAYGESAGRAITFGVNESHGVQSARRWIGSRDLGSRSRPSASHWAAILLAPSPAGFDALVLEAVCPDARRALQNRMRMRVGPAAPVLGELLEWRLEPRLQISLDQLRPIDPIDAVGASVMVIAGGRDRHTAPAESAELFATARSPKWYWLLPQAAHQDFE
ncbi:MAG TPA: alpha/beta hydrolase, partial [Pseudoxanthomonas sp.]|nr:alpha/beta hydrolase [Pseudoxanthomonas sp.]